MGFEGDEDGTALAPKALTDASGDLDATWAVGPTAAILHGPQTSPASDRPPTRSGNYRAGFTGADSSIPGRGSQIGAVASAAPLSSTPSRRLPGISLDVSPATPGLPPTGNSSFSGGGVTLPSASAPSSPSPSPEAKKSKSFVMASLAIGLNEVVQINDAGDDENGLRAQAKTGGGDARSPKKYQLGLPQRSASPSHTSPKSTSPSTSSQSSPTNPSGKLVPIGRAAAGGTSRSLMFDSIVSGGSKGTEDTSGSRMDTSPNYRRTVASRSPLRDRLAQSNGSGDAAADGSEVHTAPSKLDPLDTESVRCSSLTSSTTATSAAPTSAAASERKSVRLPPSSRLDKPQPQDSKAASSSPEKQTMFRNPFKKSSGAQDAKRDKKSRGAGDGEGDDQGTDLGGHTLSSTSPGGSDGGSVAPALTPLDELSYLSFSPRPTGASALFVATGSKQRDLPSLSLSPGAKDSGAPSPRKAKKLKHQQQQERPDHPQGEAQAK
ncbi:hypothetical protein PybrP1_010868 [[Pythium] brassicae (nom. inval.)]|nr:hypothetical protein PybrP1_010868 [[Pythium] brassicae (nom. inval.)]